MHGVLHLGKKDGFFFIYIYIYIIIIVWTSLHVF